MSILILKSLLKIFYLYICLLFFKLSNKNCFIHTWNVFGIISLFKKHLQFYFTNIPKCVCFIFLKLLKIVITVKWVKLQTERRWASPSARLARLVRLARSARSAKSLTSSSWRRSTTWRSKSSGRSEISGNGSWQNASSSFPSFGCRDLFTFWTWSFSGKCLLVLIIKITVLFHLVCQAFLA